MTMKKSVTTFIMPLKTGIASLRMHEPRAILGSQNFAIGLQAYRKEKEDTTLYIATTHIMV